MTAKKLELNKKSIWVLISQIFSVFLFSVVIVPKFIDAQQQESISVQSEVEDNKVAQLSIIPEKANISIGRNSQIQILVHPERKPINAVGVHIKYPPDMLEVMEIDTSSSFCTLFPEKEINNHLGRVDISCGLPSPGFNQHIGIVANLVIKAKRTGIANISFSSRSQVLANDGFGTNILKSSHGSVFNLTESPITVTPQPTEVEGSKSNDIRRLPIAIRATHHPSQLDWYQANSAEFTWSAPEDATSYTYLIDDQVDTIPDPTLLLDSNSPSYSDLEDGIWYFHLAAIYAEGTGPVSHYKIQIDTSPPENLRITKAEDINKNEHLIEFTAEDTTSGISRYEITDGSQEPVSAASPATLYKNELQSNKITITAYDNAGNSSMIEYEIPGEESDTIIDALAEIVRSIIKFFQNL
ncbi:MAG TPA: hypothetical protein ENI23_17585 [bacterium]|nr:hypothetical protein [bacterium]